VAFACLGGFGEIRRLVVRRYRCTHFGMVRSKKARRMNPEVPDAWRAVGLSSYLARVEPTRIDGPVAEGAGALLVGGQAASVTARARRRACPRRASIVRSAWRRTRSGSARGRVFPQAVTTGRFPHLLQARVLRENPV
jgi:hypothetical protein